MSAPGDVNHSSTCPHWLGRWWRHWRDRRAAVAELNCYGDDEVARLARDVGVNSADLRIFAGKWPDAAELLTREQLNAPTAVRQADLKSSAICKECAPCAGASANAGTI